MGLHHDTLNKRCQPDSYHHESEIPYARSRPRLGGTMSTIATMPGKSDMVYPESDGLPMADNTKQFRWIVTIQGGLDALFKDEPNVFVAGDLLWYPVEGKPTIRLAPDV